MEKLHTDWTENVSVDKNIKYFVINKHLEQMIAELRYADAVELSISSSWIYI